VSVTIREATDAERPGWDELIETFPNRRVVHTTAWLAALEGSGYGRPLQLVFERDGVVVACLPGLLRRLGPLRLFGSPLPGWETASMGPAFDPAAVTTAEMAAALVPLLERRYGVHHIELVSPDLDGAAMAALGFRSEVVPTYRGPLYPGDEAKSFRLLKESARRNIKRAEKLGLTAVIESDERFVDEHYEQLKEVYERGGHAITFRKSRALECFRRLAAAGKLVAVSVRLPDGTSIATGMFTIDAGELLLWTWAHRIAHRWYRPTELLTWTVMRRAVAAGCTRLDLMGLGDFKAKFGASLDETKRRWVRSRYAWLTQMRDLAERGYRLQQTVRGRLGQWRHSLGAPTAAAAEDT